MPTGTDRADVPAVVKTEQQHTDAFGPPAPRVPVSEPTPAREPQTSKPRADARATESIAPLTAQPEEHEPPLDLDATEQLERLSKQLRDLREPTTAGALAAQAPADARAATPVASPPTSPAATTPEKMATHARSAGTLTGSISDAESVAASAQESLTFKPGTPLAGKGVRVATSVPKFSISTRVALRPKSPVVVVQFARDGSVKRAFFAPGQDSGVPQIDGPILDAVYRWSASGKALQELPIDDPLAVATFRVQWLLQ